MVNNLLTASLKLGKKSKKNSDPRKPTYLLVQKPINEGALPKVFATCGGKHHDDGKKLIPETVV
jgi:hypothetical protein